MAGTYGVLLIKNAAFWFAGLLLCSNAQAADTPLKLQQLDHRAWSVADGAPPDPNWLVQTTDGTLWLGSGAGLFRFDGIRFEAFPGPGEAPFESNDIYTLTASPDGGLWIGFRWGGVVYLHGGRVVHYGESEGLPPGAVERILIDHQGGVWVAAIGGLAHLQGSKFEPVVFDASDPHAFAWSVLEDRAGTLWVLGQNSVMARPADTSNFREIARRTYTGAAYGRDLVEAPDGAIWAANVDDRGFLRLDPPTKPRPVANRLTSSLGAGTVAFDREGNLWFDSKKNGVGRIASGAVKADLNDAQLADRAEYINNPRGFDYFLEDREGNLWISSRWGIERFTPTNVVRVDVPATDGDLIIAAADAGSVIVAAKVNQSESRVFEIRGDTVIKGSSGPRITSSFRDADGTIWLNGPAGISRYENGRAQAIPIPTDVTRTTAMTRDAKGDLWVAFGGHTLYRLSHGLWSNAISLLPTLPSLTIVTAASDPRGRLWLGYNRRLAIVEGAKVQIFDARDGLDLGAIGAIVACPTHAWVGGELGLARFEGTRFSIVSSAPGRPFVGISGMVETAAGDLWLNTSVGIVHVAHTEIERNAADPTHPVQYDAFTYADGVPGLMVVGSVRPSIIEATDGRIWFVSPGRLAYIDPSQLRRNTLPPPVTIWSIDSGGIRYPATLPAIRLPIGTTNLRISYTAGSLTVPEHIRFRYKLEGLDRDWRDAVDRREVEFTNLGPGQYTFHVIASNNDGVWNMTGSTLPFTVIPAFHQTKLFYGLCAVVSLGLLRALYLIRIRQVSAQVRGRLEERLAERERIARDLHDTLLQSVQGLVLRFRVGVNGIPKQEPGRLAMERALDRADEVLVEGRDRVKALRFSPNDHTDLSVQLAALGDELAVEPSPRHRLTVEGVPRAIHAVVGEEVMFIAREALINAFRHANAQQIETEISYGDAELRLRIRDDGRGIDDDVLQRGGREGHWGLLGMRERAKKLYATLTIWSKLDAGTELDLRVPARIAYRSRPRARFIQWWRKKTFDRRGQ